MFEPNV